MTYYDRPVLKEPVWIWSVPAYFYAGGAAGAAGALGAVAHALGGEDVSRLVRRCRVLAAAGTAVGGVLLVIDLGRPERFLNMLRVFRRTSPLSVGSWVLAVSASSAAASLLRGPSGHLAGGVAGVAGVPLSGYTAVLLSSTAVPVWRQLRRTLPALFVASGTASAASLLELGELGPHEHRIVRRFGIAGGLGELAAMFAVERDARGAGRAGRALTEGLPGALWKASKALAAAGVAISIMPGRSRGRRTASGVLGTAAALGVRFAVFHAGFASARDPRAVLEATP